MGTRELAKRGAVPDSGLNCRRRRYHHPRRARPPSSRAPQRFSGPGRAGGKSRWRYPLLWLGPRDSGDSRWHATVSVRHSRAPVRPIPQPARRLAILARADPSRRCDRLVLRRLDPSGRDRNRRGIVVGIGVFGLEPMSKTVTTSVLPRSSFSLDEDRFQSITCSFRVGILQPT